MFERWTTALGLALMLAAGAAGQARNFPHPREAYEDFFGDMICEEIWFDYMPEWYAGSPEDAGQGVHIDAFGHGNCPNANRNEGEGERHMSKMLSRNPDSEASGIQLIDTAVGLFAGGDERGGRTSLIRELQKVAPLTGDPGVDQKLEAYYQASTSAGVDTAPDPASDWSLGDQLVGGRGGLLGRGTNERGDLGSGGEIDDHFWEAIFQIAGVQDFGDFNDGEFLEQLRDELAGAAQAMGREDPENTLENLRESCILYGEAHFALQLRDRWISYFKHLDPAIQLVHYDFSPKARTDENPAGLVLNAQAPLDELGLLHARAEDAFKDCFVEQVEVLQTCESAFRAYGSARGTDAEGEEHTITDYEAGLEGLTDYCAERLLAEGNLDNHPPCTQCVDIGAIEAAAADEENLRAGCRALFLDAGRESHRAGPGSDQEASEEQLVLLGRQRFGRDCAASDGEGEGCDCFDEEDLEIFRGDGSDEEMTGAGGGASLEEMTGEIAEGPAGFESYQDCVDSYSEAVGEVGDGSLQVALDEVADSQGQLYQGRLSQEGIRRICAAAFREDISGDGVDYRPQGWDEGDASSADESLIGSTGEFVGMGEGGTQEFLAISPDIWLGQTAQRLASELCAGADDQAACIAEFRIWEPGGLIDYLAEANYENVGFDRFIAGEMLWVPPERCIASWKEGDEIASRGECDCFYSMGNQNCPRCEDLPAVETDLASAQAAAQEAETGTIERREQEIIASALEGERQILEEAGCN